MQKWEQIAVKATSREELDESLKQYSMDGWELVSVTGMSGMQKAEVRGGLAYHDVPWMQWDMFFRRTIE